MINKRKIFSAFFAAVVAVSISGCSMIQKTPEAIANSAVAVVNGEKITNDQLNKDPNTIQLIAQAKQQYGDNYSSNEEATSIIKSQKEQILDNMITQLVLSQKAKELNIMPSDSKINSDAQAQIDKMKKQYFSGDESKFEAALSQQGLTEKAFKDMYISQVKSQEVQESISQYLTKNIKITDKQIEEYYNKNKDKYTELPNKMTLKHILVKTKADAQKVKSRLDKGESFDTVAKEVSQDTATKNKGGDLGTIKANDTNYDSQFMAGANALKEGQISDPIQSNFGWHIIKCTKKITYPVKKLSEVKSTIKTQLESDSKTKLINEKITQWKKDAKITKKEKNIQ
ncbi:peptidylprolyl isomerase [Clostridium tyrobutyricum]|uniref:peptidylprolyl isomerase n=1 Tax=Clostridium tyrobutyricum DIVETGP TaxID=1408889 RepID=W6N860_CLOTY|nr:peptidylprolyl isomerase [Clostridium tyrobutyricum]AND86183.1 foldase protein PrsA [Clostridium tyrobutyricum]ANP70677.1 peptidylprolyl isomerase [Clostridium tyrobutyricum]MBR9648251.1 peptidylprolyl isomerase [Clostridium tyrobutyricum]MBV4429014.1 peptidylprolyl isomerase [Clostridium tyrobutyricum]MBV4431727.1 peptidylprolyl isomerase [Clostridium tyrobutyricum]